MARISKEGTLHSGRALPAANNDLYREISWRYPTWMGMCDVADTSGLAICYHPHGASCMGPDGTAWDGAASSIHPTLLTPAAEQWNRATGTTAAKRRSWAREA